MCAVHHRVCNVSKVGRLTEPLALQASDGVFIASQDFVSAITFKKISDGTFGTVFLSIGLAGIVVFVFTGRPGLTLMSTACVLAINLVVRPLRLLRCERHSCTGLACAICIPDAVLTSCCILGMPQVAGIIVCKLPKDVYGLLQTC